MEHFHPGLPKDEYVRISFISVNSVLGVIQTMIYDETQTYDKSQLSKELKAMVSAYLQSRTKSN